MKIQFRLEITRDFLRLYKKKKKIRENRISIRNNPLLLSPRFLILSTLYNRGERVCLCLKNNASLEEDWRKNFASFPSRFVLVSGSINNFVAINASAMPGTELLAGIGGKNWWKVYLERAISERGGRKGKRGNEEKDTRDHVHVPRPSSLP